MVTPGPCAWARPGDTPRLSVPAKAAFEHVSEFSFNGGQVGVQEFASWNHNDVEPGREFIVTEYFSDETLRSISDDRAAYLLGRRNPQPAYALVV